MSVRFLGFLAFAVVSAAGFGAWYLVGDRSPSGVFASNRPAAVLDATAQARVDLGIESEAKALGELRTEALDAVAAGRQKGGSGQGLDVSSLDRLDPDWAQFPRESAPLAPDVIKRGCYLECARVFRHRDLNPQDVYIQPEVRMLLIQGVAGYAAKLKAIGSLESDASTLEMDALILSGSLESKLIVKGAMDDDPDVVSLRAKVPAAFSGQASVAWSPQALFGGRRPYIYRVVGDRCYGADLPQLPQTRLVVELKVFCALELAHFLAGAFDVIDPGTRQHRVKFLDACYSLSSSSNSTQHLRK